MEPSNIIQPHILDKAPDGKKKPSIGEMQEAIVRVACMVLLFERENETLVQAALANLAQERHNQFHTKEGNKKKGDGTSFQDCGNEICQDVYNILTNCKKPVIEFSSTTAELMLTKYDLNVAKSALSDKAFVALKEKGKIDPPELPEQLLNPGGLTLPL